MVTRYIVPAIFAVSGISLIWGTLSGTGWALRVFHNETKKMLDDHMEFMQKIQTEAEEKHMRNSRRMQRRY